MVEAKLRPTRKERKTVRKKGKADGKNKAAWFRVKKSLKRLLFQKIELYLHKLPIIIPKP